ncbi:hypothetical protein QCA50_011262 [Cerrena zonata]|uniref:Uncharacterized protein n=1 Tax=Cerrena zonata TaxID=2478898 RepID=A0AAW0G232_9APHY
MFTNSAIQHRNVPGGDFPLSLHKGKGGTSIPHTTDPTVMSDGFLLESSQASLSEAYLAVAAVSMWTWDLILGIDEDVRMFSGRAFKPYDFAYVMARIATGGFLVSPAAAIVTDGASCHRVMRAVAWFEAIALIFNSSLFLFRVLGVFSRSLRTRVVFGLLWLTTFSTLAIPPSAAYIHLVPGCDISEVKPVALACFITVTVFDTLVFLSISVRMLSINADIIHGHPLATFFHGRGLGNVTKTVLRTGQLYYSVTIGAHLLALIALVSPTSVFPPPYQAGFTLMSMTMQNIMGCKVFRLLRLGVIQPDPATMVESSIQFSTPTTTRYTSNDLAFSSSTDGVPMRKANANGVACPTPFEIDKRCPYYQ